MSIRISIRLLRGMAEMENVNVNRVAGFLGVEMTGNDGVDGGIWDGKERGT